MTGTTSLHRGQCTATNSQHLSTKQEIPKSNSNFSVTHHLLISPSAHNLQKHAGYQQLETKDVKIKKIYQEESFDEMEIKSSPNHFNLSLKKYRIIFRDYGNTHENILG